MNTIKRFAATTAFVALLLGMSGCTVIGVGVGAAAGAGSSVGAVGGAVIGGVVGYAVSK